MAITIYRRSSEWTNLLNKRVHYLEFAKNKYSAAFKILVRSFQCNNMRSSTMQFYSIITILSVAILKFFPKVCVSICSGIKRALKVELSWIRTAVFFLWIYTVKTTAQLYRFISVAICFYNCLTSLFLSKASQAWVSKTSTVCTQSFASRTCAYHTNREVKYDTCSSAGRQTLYRLRAKIRMCSCWFSSLQSSQLKCSITTLKVALEFNHFIK